MRMTFALAALFAATAITPALAQDNNGRSDRGDRGARMEQRGGGGGGWQRGGGERPQGGWQRGPQAAPQAAPAPQVQAAPQPRPERQWNGNRGDGNGGMNAQRNWGARQDGQRNWQRNDAPQSQLGGTPAAPPVVVNRGNGGDRQRWDGNRGERGGWSGTFGANNGQAWQQNPNRNDTWRDRDRPRDDGNRWNNGNRPDNRNWNNNRGGNWNGNNGWNRGNDWNGRAWNRDWRRNQQYDWQRYRYSNRNLFRANPYYVPRGWSYGYQRFSIGFMLNSLLFDQQYWIDDPYEYRLPPVYGPYRWVRYYDDVLLVDIRSGQVVDVINDFFW